MLKITLKPPRMMNQTGSSLLSVLVASAITGILIAVIGKVFIMAQQQKNRLVSDVDAIILQMDIKKGLSTNELCMKYFTAYNEKFDLRTSKVRMMLPNSEMIDTDQTLEGYHLESVNLLPENVQNLGTNKAGNIFYSAELIVSMKRKSSNIGIKPKTVGTIFLETQPDGTLVNCNSSSMFDLVQCDAGELKVSSGSNANDAPLCRSIEEIVGEACPSEHVLVSTGTGIQCRSLATAANPLPSPTPQPTP